MFGVFFWFVVLPGPTGAVLYRLAEHVARAWNRPPAPPTPPDRFGEFAAQAFAWIDWAPARLTALGFAIVGDFEGAIYCWRQVARRSAAPGDAGARFPYADPCGGQWRARIAADAGRGSARYFDEAGNEGAGLAEPRHTALRSVVGLVWRSLLFG